MDSSARFDDTSSSDEEAFYSSLNMEDIRDVEYRNAKRALNYLNANNKNLGVYRDLYL